MNKENKIFKDKKIVTKNNDFWIKKNLKKMKL